MKQIVIHWQTYMDVQIQNPSRDQLLTDIRHSNAHYTQIDKHRVGGASEAWISLLTWILVFFLCPIFLVPCIAFCYIFCLERIYETIISSCEVENSILQENPTLISQSISRSNLFSLSAAKPGLPRQNGLVQNVPSQINGLSGPREEHLRLRL